MVESFSSFSNSSSRVLEIGASDIERTRQLSELCGELTGLEYMPDRKPKNFGNVNYVLGDCHELSKIFAPASFDVVLANHVIEHLRDDLAAMNEIYQVLKPGGFALLATPNRKRLTRVVIEFFTGKRDFSYKEHAREYAEKDLIELVRHSSFNSYQIIPRFFGVYGGPIRFYSEKVPKKLRKFANFWEIHLFK